MSKINARSDGSKTKRALLGKQWTGLEHCDRCGHYKTLETSTYVKCSKCGKIHRRM